jgi:hypothetical protein
MQISFPSIAQRFSQIKFNELFANIIHWLLNYCEISGKEFIVLSNT